MVGDGDLLLLVTCTGPQSRDTGMDRTNMPAGPLAIDHLSTHHAMWFNKIFIIS